MVNYPLTSKTVLIKAFSPLRLTVFKPYSFTNVLTLWTLKKIESMLESLKFLKMMKKDFGEYIIRAITVRDNLNLWDDKGTHTQRLLKRSLIDFLCRIQNAECLRTST